MPLNVKATIESIFSGPISSAKASGKSKKSAAKASGKRKTRDEMLRLWQERLQDNRDAYRFELDRFDRRARYYEGENLIEPLTAYDTKPNGEYYATSHVRNIVAEMIEAQISSVIPHPKVTAKRQEDEERARLIERMLESEIDRLGVERLCDLMERLVPINGGAYWMAEWDSSGKGRGGGGDVVLSVVHPSQVIPQDGVTGDVEDMDYFIVGYPQTKTYVKARFGVDVENESESAPEIRTLDDDDRRPADDLVTLYYGYYRNDEGGVGRYAWVNDTSLEDLDDLWARQLERCAECGRLKPLFDVDTAPELVLGKAQEEADRQARREMWEASGLPVLDERSEVVEPEDDREGAEDSGDVESGSAGFTSIINTGRRPGVAREGDDVCPYCGSRHFERARVDYEELPTEITTPLGQQIGGMTSATDAKGLFYDRPTRIPLYRVDKYPLVIHKNISVYGRLMGASDVDAIADHQNTTNRLHQKIIDRSIQSGSIITAPVDARIRVDSKDGKVIRLKNPAEKEEFGVYNLDSDVSQQRAYLAEVYEEARQRIGITDSYQGRRDTTAQSGVAKQFAAAQSAGRLESKRRMKEAVFADLYERIFKLKLAYADTGVSVLGYDAQGAPEYLEFSRYDFLRQNPLTLEWEWNDDFTFSIDPSGELAGNRQSMWQETIALYQAGAFGNLSALESLVVLWSKLERASYPDAASTKDYFQRALEAQQQAQQQAQLQAQQQAQLQQQQQAAPPAADVSLNPAPPDSPVLSIRAYGPESPERATLNVPAGTGNAASAATATGALPPELTSAIEARAREDAWRDVRSRAGV
ncbi:MAG: hypothetical protein LBK23_09565 [Oscillospiraceae bacterium]|jgi:hypothetical protein|nr:hypothetical protein [Oscillospiraceae bacterium]